MRILFTLSNLRWQDCYTTHLLRIWKCRVSLPSVQPYFTYTYHQFFCFALFFCSFKIWTIWSQWVARLFEQHHKTDRSFPLLYVSTTIAVLHIFFFLCIIFFWTAIPLGDEGLRTLIPSLKACRSLDKLSLTSVLLDK